MARPAGADLGVLVLGGPTAGGKSEVAAELAHSVGGAVVSGDSRQLYRGLEIGTAQPDAALRERAPHFLVGFLSPAAEYSAGSFAEDVRRVVWALRRRRTPVVLCGGTGLYLRAALGGVFREPARARSAAGAAPSRSERCSGAVGTRARRAVRAALEARWQREGAQALHAELARVDPFLARRLHPHDRQRVLRGLEFHAARGMPLSEAWTEIASGSRERDPLASSMEPAQLDAAAALRVAPRYRLELPAAELEARIEARLEGMLRRGLLEEARELFECYGDDPPRSLDAVGYPELFRHFRGETDLEETLRSILLRTRRYAKRQRTWFRHQDGYQPVRAGESAVPILLRAWREAGR
jgi:tRNA dimethylallyltransferase